MASMVTISATEHPIKSVTVFRSRKAEIVRVFSLNLERGQTKIEIENLPTTIDTDSVRVSGLGDARLYDVVCTIGSKSPSYDPDSSSEMIRVLNAKKVGLESMKRVREHEADLLMNYGKSLTGEHVVPSVMSKFLENFVEQGRKNIEAVLHIGEQIIETNREIEKEQEKSKSKKGTTKGKVDIVIGTDATQTIELKLTYIVGKVLWDPTYELRATTDSGKPLSSVELHYRARLRQDTGEDWKDVLLTLSTVTSDTVAKEIPSLSPVKIREQTNIFAQRIVKNNNGFYNSGGLFGTTTSGPAPNVHSQAFANQQAPVHQQAPLFGGSQQGGSGFTAFGVQAAGQPQSHFGSAGDTFRTAASAQQHVSHFGDAPQQQGGFPPPIEAATDPSATEDLEFEEIAVPSPFSEPTTIVTETPMAIAYSVHGQSTIPTDGLEHQVAVAVLSFDVKISHVCIPRIDPRVYLQCHVRNTSDYRLLPGPVSVILDDSFVSKTMIRDVNIGDNFDCTLGDDPTTKVTYSRTSKTVKSDAEAFTESVNTTTYTTLIKVHNKHQFAITNLIVRDLVPTSDDKRAKVILRKPEDLATAKEGEEIKVGAKGLAVMWEKMVDDKGGKKEGRFEWRWSVEGGAKVTLEAKWEVRAPVDLQLAETVVPSFFQKRFH